MHGPYDVARYETSGVPLTQALPTLKGLVEAKLHCSGLSCTQKLEGSAWGHVPQGNVFFFISWHERLFLGPNITTNFCFSPGLVTDTLCMSARMEISVHRWFQAPGEPHERTTHASQSEFCLVFNLNIFQATPAENVWPPHSKSAHS